MKCCDEDPNGEEPLGRLIYLLSQDMKNFAEKVLKPYDLTLEQLHILKSMSVTSGMSQRQIGEIARKKAANITRMLDRLESKNLVQRKENLEDRRAASVFLTIKGKALVNEVIGIFDSFSTSFLRGVSSDKQQLIRNSFEKMTQNLERMSREKI
ncbi:MAG: MarR family transcriptional regulator [Desulfobulbaceae bacterium]|uniref:MarR family transcriptional regulator n=1 Tax=Candidatus Desulfobia pelagia TaxID=2841692 RepID=A0A8J6NFE6_9BACT|nr:MarR family transcriptional regulator [Candidatus Desulfobia pelagia]